MPPARSTPRSRNDSLSSGYSDSLGHDPDSSCTGFKTVSVVIPKPSRQLEREIKEADWEFSISRYGNQMAAQGAYTHSRG